MSSFGLYISSRSLSITHHAIQYTTEPKCTNNIQCFKDRSLTQFFLVFFLTVRYSSCFSFGTASAAAADDDGDGGGGGGAAVVVVIFLFYIFFAIFFHSPTTSLILLSLSVFHCMLLDFPFRFGELKTIFTFICKYFLFVCSLYRVSEYM